MTPLQRLINDSNIKRFRETESQIIGDGLVKGFICLECGNEFDHRHGNFIRGFNGHCDKCTIEKYGCLNDFYVETIKQMLKEVKG